MEIQRLYYPDGEKVIPVDVQFFYITLRGVGGKDIQV